MEYLVVGRIPVGVTLRHMCDRWDPANSTWIAERKTRSQSGLPGDYLDPTSIVRSRHHHLGSQMGLGWYHAKILASFLPCDNILENPMQSSVRNHDAFSNNKTWKEIQICHAKFVFLRITNMFNVNAVSQHHDWNHDPCRIPMNELKLSVTEKQGICVENIQSASNFIIFSFVG